MGFTGIAIMVLVVALDVAAGILGLHAYNLQNQVKHVEFLFFECRQPSHDAYTFGIVAACLLLAAHVIANVAGGCICFGSREQFERSPTSKQIAGICLLLLWIALGIGFALLLLGAMYNDEKRNLSCSLSKHKFLWFGGLICFVHAALAVAYYVSSTSMISALDNTIRGLSMSPK